MGGQWKHRNDAAAHRRARRAGLALLADGAPCVRCGHEMWPAADILNLDHADDGSYLGFSHSSPCRTCGERCNQKAGGIKGAIAGGKQLRTRPCVICGKAFTASRSADGAKAVTCGSRACLREIRSSRKARRPDPAPPPSSGRAW